MGGAPVLVLVAALGVSFGWTPDDSGGVEYIIQIPPEQLEDVRRSGQIDSAIPREIRGHVSRVIIRVGDGDLPRQTPIGMNAAVKSGGNTVPLIAVSPIRTADQQHVPIPAIGLAETSHAVTGTSRSQVMKPSPQGGSSFAMPTTAGGQANGTGFPSTVNQIPSQLADQARASANQAARNVAGTVNNSIDQTFSNLANSAGNALRDGVSSTTGTPNTFGGNTNTRAGIPDFAGSAGPSNPGLNRPTTAPTTNVTRDKDWAAANLNRPTTAPRGASTPGSQFAMTSGQVSDTRSNSTPGFGELPSGLRNAPTSNPSPQQNATFQPYPRLTNEENQHVRRYVSGYDSSNRPLDSTGRPLDVNKLVSDYRLQQQTLARSQQNATTSGQIGSLAGSNSQPSATSGFTGYQANPTTVPSYSNPQLGVPSATTSPYPRIATTPTAGVAGPGFSYGTPRNGGATAAVDPYELDRLKQQNALLSMRLETDRLESQRRERETLAANSDASRTGRGAGGADNSGQSGKRVGAEQRPQGGVSPSDREPLSGTASQAGVLPRGKGIAASQPLPNLLLLISVVANLFLGRWLMHLRVQFRDVIAAKRIASTPANGG